MGPRSCHHCRPLLLLLPTLWRSRLPSQRPSLSQNLRPRPSPVTITDQTLWSPSRSQAQRENQSRSPTDQATPSSAPSPPSSSLSSLPSPSRAPLVHTSQTSSTPSCLPNTQFLPFSLLPVLQHLLQ